MIVFADCGDKISRKSTYKKEGGNPKSTYRAGKIFAVCITPQGSKLTFSTTCLGPISASLRPGNTAPFEEMSQRWRAVGNTVSDLTGPRLELLWRITASIMKDLILIF